MNTHKPHIKLAHERWLIHLRKGCHVIDATCGNGYDSLFLAQHALTETAGALHCFDIQSHALQITEKRLKSGFSDAIYQRIHFYHCSHENLSFPDLSIDLVCYNLGYLPGGDKKITTGGVSTISSLRSALRIIKKSGLISVTCYPGHEEGKNETEMVNYFFNNLSPHLYQIEHFQWKRSAMAPQLFLLQRRFC